MSVVVTNRAGSPVRVHLRIPKPTDGAGLWRLVDGCEALDTNSPYAYLLVCSHFADTSVVAEVAEVADVAEVDGLSDGNDRDGGVGVGGFMSAYRLPASPGTLFVWQIAVAPEHRGLGLGRAMLEAVLDRPSAKGSTITHVEATVTPDNAASDRLFRSFAAARGAPVEVDEAFSPDLFPEGPQVAHGRELRYRIGPIRSP